MIFSKIDPAKLQNDNENACMVLYDYLSVYLDFSGEKCEDPEVFKKAKGIVQKYDDFPIESFRKMFLKMKELLDEIEHSSYDANNVDENGIVLQDTMSAEKAQPLVNDLKIDENGTIKAEIQNIGKITVKYYLIDAEILFSRSPFVRDQATDFSFLMPYHTELLELNGLRACQVGIPQKIKGKNVAIEMNFDAQYAQHQVGKTCFLQEFRTFYSSMIKVQINEKLGELKVFADGKSLSKAYVKVFCL